MTRTITILAASIASAALGTSSAIDLPKPLFWNASASVQSASTPCSQPTTSRCRTSSSSRPAGACHVPRRTRVSAEGRASPGTLFLRSPAKPSAVMVPTFSPRAHRSAQTRNAAVAAAVSLASTNMCRRRRAHRLRCSGSRHRITSIMTGWLFLSTDYCRTADGPLSARISQTPRPCVPAARMFRLGLSFNSTTWAFGRPVPNTDQCKPKSIDEKTPRSVPK
jgi:hypothetical protein